MNPSDELCLAADRWRELQEQTDAARADFWRLVGKHLRAARRAAGVTIDDLSGRLHYAKSTLSNIERGDLCGRCLPATRALWEHFKLGAFPCVEVKTRRQPHGMRKGA